MLDWVGKKSLVSDPVHSLPSSDPSSSEEEGKRLAVRSSAEIGEAAA
jgi:hypothetical protein